MTGLDNPIWAALTGPQAEFAEVHGSAGRYQRHVTPFYALAHLDDPRAWADLAELAEPGEEILLPYGPATPPPGWEVVRRFDGWQLVDEEGGNRHTHADADLEKLTAADVPEMMDLIGRTEPGPFLPRTIELGTYLGIRRNGVLVAMAGERIRLPGWTESSALCVDPAYRRQGLARRLKSAVVAGIRARGDEPFAHVAADNARSIALNRSMGFTPRRSADVAFYRQK